jgi:hypothetical protein
MAVINPLKNTSTQVEANISIYVTTFFSYDQLHSFLLKGKNTIKQLQETLIGLPAVK